MPHVRKFGLMAALSLALTAGAPGAAQAYEAEYAPIKIQANKDTWLRLLAFNQIWTRVVENNPGTVLRADSRQDWTADIGIRRARFLAFGKVGRALLMFHLGINNQSFVNNAFGDAERDGTSGPNFFVHDAWTEFEVVKNDLIQFYAGAGLHYWNGVSRFTNSSTLNLLAVDGPITNWNNINGNDQFARQIGIYIKGKLLGGLFDYRIALNRPFPTGRGGLNRNANTFATAGYLQIQLLEKESNTLPYFVGTYVGKKKLLNFGAGWYYQPDAGINTGLVDDQDDVIHLGMDVFTEIPFGEKGEGGALTAYSALWRFDYGSTGFVLPVGIMPITAATDAPVDPNNASQNGAYNRYHTLGQGTVGYVQLGYLLPNFSNVIKIQPYVTAQFNQWDAFESLTPVLETGANFYLLDHHSKFTLHYRARPIVRGDGTGGPGDETFDRFASEFILQTMVFL